MNVTQKQKKMLDIISKNLDIVRRRVSRKSQNRMELVKTLTHCYFTLIFDSCSWLYIIKICIFKLVEKYMGEYSTNSKLFRIGTGEIFIWMEKDYFLTCFINFYFFIIILIFKFSCDFYALHIFIFYSYI